MKKFSLYDNWKLANNNDDFNDDIAFLCDFCGEPIYVNDEYIHTNEGKVHDDCFDELAWEVLDVSRQTAEKEVDYGEDG
jgi:hypothetical protein